MTTEVWNPPYPAHREPGWFERSSWAERDWRAALNAYWDDRARLGFPWRPDPTAHRHRVEYAQHVADERVRIARADYRKRVLSWYHKLCEPLGPGKVVPNEVSKLQWEQWDIDGRDAADAIHLSEESCPGS